MDVACNLAKKWLPPILDDDKRFIMNIFTGTEITIGIPLIRKYIELLRPYTKVLNIDSPRESDCLASGLVFFYGCLIYIMHFPKWGEHIQDIFLYNILYILVDHYIDDIRINPDRKKKTIAQMFLLIHDPLSYKQMELEDDILETIAIVYHKLITRCPSVKSAIVNLFRAEVDGLAIQQDNLRSREDYYTIACKKGGYTLHVLQRIVGNNELDESAYQLGEIMQLLDDVIDVIADKNNGINTIATYYLSTRGTLDELWIDIVNKIGAIDRRFTIFIILYSIFAVYIPGRIPAAYSAELCARTSALNLFDYKYGCDGSSLLVDAIMNELVAMEILDTTNINKLCVDNQRS